MQAALQLGAMHADSWKQDPKHLGFVLARYKFVAKMVTGLDRVLEIGCGDCTGARIVIDVVNEWHGIDNNPRLVNGAPNTSEGDIVHGGIPLGWDAIYMLDVLEHIQPAHEHKALDNIRAALYPGGFVIIGMPSKESQTYASRLSKEHHVNCKTEDELRKTMQRHFNSVFLFGMNDETLHTGFGPMCHYRLAIGTGARQ